MTGIVFVVGAGASHEYGLPLGGQLITRIADSLTFGLLSETGFRGPVATALLSQGFSLADVQDAAKWLSFGLTSQVSIDRLIGARREAPLQVRLGKLAIAEAIFRAEHESEKLYPLAVSKDDAIIRQKLFESRDSWLGQLMLHLGGGLNRTTIKRAFEGVTFVVFNYDRCIELHLYNLLRFAFQMEKDEACDTLQSISIHHVYGSLGPLTFRSSGDVNFGDFGADLNASADRIRTFTEDSDNSTLIPIHIAMQEADKVVYLGFGYEELNCRLIVRDGKNIEAHKAWGTAYYDPLERDLRRDALQNLLGGAAAIEGRFENWEARHFMARKGRSILYDHLQRIK